MTLSDKYKTLIDLANKHHISVKEENGVLRINGEVTNGDIKDEMWKVYNQLDPNFKSGEIVLNVESGIYLMKVSNETKNLTRKLIKL